MAAQSYMLPGILTDSCFDKGQGRMVSEIDNGDWIKISGVDFGKRTKCFKARIATPVKGAAIEIRLDSPEGALVGTCTVKPTGSWDKWKTVKSKISGATGKHDLYLKFTGGEGFLFNFNWWQFK